MNQKIKTLKDHKSMIQRNIDHFASLINSGNKDPKIANKKADAEAELKKVDDEIAAEKKKLQEHLDAVEKI